MKRNEKDSRPRLIIMVVPQVDGDQWRLQIRSRWDETPPPPETVTSTEWADFESPDKIRQIADEAKTSMNTVTSVALWHMVMDMSGVNLGPVG